MSEFKKLEDEFTAKVKVLQDTCDHEPGEWADIYDHHPSFTGFLARFCIKCRKRLAYEKAPKGYRTKMSIRFEQIRAAAKPPPSPAAPSGGDEK